MRLEEEIAQDSFNSQYHKLAINIIYTYNWLRSYHEKLFKPYGITMQQYNILRILRGQYPNTANIKLIRERMLDKMSDCSRIVEKLRIKGLVDRKTCPNDRRHVDVLITEKGLDLLKPIDPLIISVDKLLSTVTKEEAVEMNTFLDKLRG